MHFLFYQAEAKMNTFQLFANIKPPFIFTPYSISWYRVVINFYDNRIPLAEVRDCHSDLFVSAQQYSLQLSHKLAALLHLVTIRYLKAAWHF